MSETPIPSKSTGIKIVRSLPSPLDKPMDELPEYYRNVDEMYQAIQELIRRQNAILKILQRVV